MTEDIRKITLEEATPQTNATLTKANMESTNPESYWFVGASWGKEDQTDRFIKKGIWQNGHDSEYLHKVLSMKPGDRIAIKSSYTRKQEVPFDNSGQPVSTMSLKVIGVITKNHGDGQTIDVDWDPKYTPREWYFYTYMGTIWHLTPDRWKAKGLIDFTFHDMPQDIDRFRNDPFWKERFGDTETSMHSHATDPDIGQETENESYTLDNIIEEGCFLEKDKLATILERLRDKKNLILQGPPGTGKTWLAKKLAFALIGYKSDHKIRAVQFHPNLSYEDFVRGWRPAGDGKLTLVDGPFLATINQAKDNAGNKHVVVIEEINRGNPAQIFGEMLTLLEADKRTPAEALELSYRRGDSERVFVPDNLYVIGTMNVADRSLALVDLALRRRFAFIDLQPTFGETWKKWVSDKYGIDTGILKKIEDRLVALNSEIESDQNLGAQFKIGHSYVTPALNAKMTDAVNWYRNVVDTEIGPLLDEYWFDDLERAKEAKKKLLEGF